jgi:hypothetical protein
MANEALIGGSIGMFKLFGVLSASLHIHPSRHIPDLHRNWLQATGASTAIYVLALLDRSCCTSWDTRW